MARRDVPVSHLRMGRCPTPCGYGTRARAHHDRLLGVDTDPTCMLELLELAITWDELDYEPDRFVQPSEWEHFVATHRWSDSDRAMRVFSLATDIVMRCRRNSHQDAATTTPVASVYSALTGRPAGDIR